MLKELNGNDLPKILSGVCFQADRGWPHAGWCPSCEGRLQCRLLNLGDPKDQKTPYLGHPKDRKTFAASSHSACPKPQTCN